MRSSFVLFTLLAFASGAGAVGPVRNILCVNQSGRELVQKSEADQTTYLNAAVQTGWTILRVDFAWELIEPSPGQFDFAAYDALVGRATALGLKLIGVLDYGNRWAAAGATDDRTPPDDPATFAAFAGAVAGHYRQSENAKTINAWEIWNEPNRRDGSTWQPSPDPARYAALVAATSKAIRKVDKRTPISTGGMAPFEDLVATGKDWSFFSTAFGPTKKQRRNAKRVKGIGFHPFMPPAAPPEVAAGPSAPSLTNQIFHAYDRLAETKLVRMSAFATGFGWPTGPGGLSDADQASFLVRGASLALAQDVGRLCWDHLADDTADGFGLFRPGTGATVAAKPAATVAATFASLVKDSVFLADLTEEFELPPGTFAVAFQASKQTIIVLWGLTPNTTLKAYQPLKSATAVRTVPLTGGDGLPCGRTDVECKKDSDGNWPTVPLTVGPTPFYLVTDDK